MNFGSYTDRGVEAAAELVNHLTSGLDRGRPVVVPKEVSSRQRMAAAAEASIWKSGGAELSNHEAEGLFRLAARLRVVFEAASRGDADRTATAINSLLREYHAAPQLACHDGEPWHLHFQSQEKEAGRARARGATCATALAIAIGSHGIRRMGICQGDRCDRVYIDTSRNGSRHFCSSTCLSRQKVAAFRARRALRPAETGRLELGASPTPPHPGSGWSAAPEDGQL